MRAEIELRSLTQNRIVIGLRRESDSEARALECELAEKHMNAAYKRAHARQPQGSEPVLNPDES